MSASIHLPAVVATVFALGAAACWSRPVDVNGSCSTELGAELGCNTAADGGAYATAPLIGYVCTGTAQPDDSPAYVNHVPQGLVCADRSSAGDGGTSGYCCSSQITDCAYDPALTCDSTGRGYQCRGGNRPESLNPLLTCTQGVRQGDFINYCCFSTRQQPGCQQSDSVSCSPRLLGWTCRGDNLPKGEQLGANKSRADYYYLLCPTPTRAANPAFNNYCCFSPALVPIGASCVQDTSVPGCQPGRFGFACYGRDTPAQDYPPMHCPEPGFSGISAEGYAATLYCCDFE